MTEPEIEILRKEIREGFRTLREDVHDVYQAVNGVMVKLLHPVEIEEIRGRMKNPPKTNGKG